MQGTVLGAKDALHRAYTVLGANLENIWGKRIPGREIRKYKMPEGVVRLIVLSTYKEQGVWNVTELGVTELEMHRLHYISGVTRGQIRTL